MLKSLTEEEKKMLESLIEVEKMTKEGTLRDVFDELKETNHLVNKRITKELFAEDFLENTAREFVQGTLQLQYLGEDADAELVNVGDYKINLKFSPILRNLLKNHEGIFSSCSLTQSLKTIVLTTLCGVMQEMRDNKLRDINSDVFVAWWFPFKLVYKAGFRIDFALDHIKRIGDEHYLIQDASSIRTAPFTRFTRRSLIFRKRLINGRQGLKI